MCRLRNTGYVISTRGRIDRLGPSYQQPQAVDCFRFLPLLEQRRLPYRRRQPKLDQRRDSYIIRTLCVQFLRQATGLVDTICSLRASGRAPKFSERGFRPITVARFEQTADTPGSLSSPLFRMCGPCISDAVCCVHRGDIPIGLCVCASLCPGLFLRTQRCRPSSLTGLTPQFAEPPEQ